MPPLEDLIVFQADRVKTLKEMSEQSRVFYGALGDYDDGAAKKHLRPVAEAPLRAVGNRLADLLKWEPERLNGVSHRLRGVRPNPLDSYFRIEEWWLAESPR